MKLRQLHRHASEESLALLDGIEETVIDAVDRLEDVVDKFEDQVDDHVYEELVPLNVRIALEENLFGWGDFISSIFAHIVITVGAFILTNISLEFFFPAKENVALMKVLISLVAAVVAFRIVQRRQHVWLRTTYGSRSYRDDELRRRREVAETDYSTLLGRIRRRREIYLFRRSQSMLRKAENRFDTWTRRGILLEETASQEEEEEQHPKFQTLPVNETKSIAKDQVMIASGLIKKVPYAHGGFFGAAPFMLANPDWVDILRRLMPDVYIEMSRRIESPARKLIHWAENNPVVAAYGNAHELQNNGRVIDLEWDIFLDPSLVKRVELVLDQREKIFGTYHAPQSSEKKSEATIKFLDDELENRVTELVDTMLVAHGNFTQLLFEQLKNGKRYNFSRVKRTRRTLGGGMRAREWMAVYAEALRLGTKMAECVIEMDTIDINEESECERSLKRSNSCPSLSSCLSSNNLDDFNVDAKECPEHLNEGLLSNTERKSYESIPTDNLASYYPDNSIAESISLLQAITKIEKPIGLILDVKSRHITKRVWSLVVRKLVAAGARVEGIASFAINDIRGVSHLCSFPIREMMFFHSAGDLQDACHRSLIKVGDIVYFNGGSLLWEKTDFSPSSLLTFLGVTKFEPQETMKKYSLLPFADTAMTEKSKIRDYKEALNLKIGIYVQEFGIDEVALDLLVKTVNENPDIYELGFGWGGMNGLSVHGIQPGRWIATDGFHTQRYGGKCWDPEKFAKDLPTS